jgi:hypothetical protein
VPQHFIDRHGRNTATDNALYDVKRAGRDRVSVSTDGSCAPRRRVEGVRGPDRTVG